MGTLSRGLILAVGLAFSASLAQAQQYASYVMDARTGKVIQAINAETRVYPASLTKMMTLYIVFDQIKHGRMSLDQKITISPYAAAEPPSKLGLRPGQQIELRYLIRAAAIKSANDAATAMGEAVGGSEAGFAAIMNQYARAMGLRNTTFVNANGLPREGHMSTAHDMAEIGRRLYYDFPQYYNIFSREATSAGLKTVKNTNRRLLDAYPGADGIKTGYTRQAGFNLVSSAQHGNERVIVAVLGAKSSASRNAEVARLMDLGFAKMPSQVRVTPPPPLNLANVVVAKSAPTAVAAAAPAAARQTPSTLAVANSKTLADAAPSMPVVAAPAPREPVAESADAVVASVDGSILRPMPRIISADAELTRNSATIAAAIAEVNSELAAAVEDADARAEAGRPLPRPAPVQLAEAAEAPAPAPVNPGSPSTFAAASAVISAPTARAVERSESVAVADAGTGSTGGNDWGVQIGAFRSKGDAERELLTTALQDVPELNGGLRRVEAAKVQGVTVFRAQFVGLSQESALGACASLARRNTDCMPLAPGI